MSAAETSLVAVRAAVYYYDVSGNLWKPADDGLSRVDLYASGGPGFRVVAVSARGQDVVVNSPLYRDLKYQRVTNLFHQWSDTRLSYGLNFPTIEEAQTFAQTFEASLAKLTTSCAPAPLQQQQHIPKRNSATQKVGSTTRGSLTSSVSSASGRSGSGGNAAVLEADSIPPPSAGTTPPPPATEEEQTTLHGQQCRKSPGTSPRTSGPVVSIAETRKSSGGGSSERPVTPPPPPLPPDSGVGGGGGCKFKSALPSTVSPFSSRGGASRSDLDALRAELVSLIHKEVDQAKKEILESISNRAASASSSAPSVSPVSAPVSTPAPLSVPVAVAPSVRAPPPPYARSPSPVPQPPQQAAPIVPIPKV